MAQPKKIYNPTNFVRMHNRIYTEPFGATNEAIRRGTSTAHMSTSTEVPAGEPYGWPRWFAKHWKQAKLHGRIWIHNPFGRTFKDQGPNGSTGSFIMEGDQWWRSKTGQAAPSSVYGAPRNQGGPITWVSGEDTDAWGTLGPPEGINPADWGNKTGNTFVDVARAFNNNGIDFTAYVGNMAHILVGNGVNNDPADFPEFKQIILTNVLAPLISGHCSIGFDDLTGDNIGTTGVTISQNDGPSGHVHQMLEYLVDELGIQIYLEPWAIPPPGGQRESFHMMSPKYNSIQLHANYHNNGPAKDLELTNKYRRGITEPTIGGIVHLCRNQVEPVPDDATIQPKVVEMDHFEVCAAYLDAFYNVKDYNEIVAADGTAASNNGKNSRMTHGNIVVGSPKGQSSYTKLSKVKEVSFSSATTYVCPAEQTNTVEHGKAVKSQDIDNISRKYIGRFKNPKLLVRNPHRHLWQPTNDNNI